MESVQLTEICTQKERKFTGRIIAAEHWKVTLPNGCEASRDVVLHPGASAIVAVDGEQRVTLVHQYRTPIQSLTLELPAGKLDSPDEAPLACAQRELREETGLIAECWEELTAMWTTPGFCNEKITLFLATGLSRCAASPDDDEFIEAERIALSDAVSRVMRGEIRDAKTALGILMAWKKLA